MPFRGSFPKLFRQQNHFKSVNHYLKDVSDIVKNEHVQVVNPDELSLTQTEKDELKKQFLAIQQAKADSSTSGSNTRSSRKKDPTERLDIFKCLGARPGHLVPESQNCAPAYGLYLSRAVLGIDIDESDEKKMEKLKALGLKMRQNKFENLVWLPDPHQDQFDLNGEWILVPIVTSDFLKEWTPGQGYYIMVVADGPYFDPIFADTVDTEKIKDIQHVNYHKLHGGLRHKDYRQSSMAVYDNVRERCEKPDFQLATDRLCDAVKAHADILDGRRSSNEEPRKINPMTIYNATNSTKEHKAALGDVQINLSSGEVKVPALKKDNLDGLEVMKVWVEGDATPDPALLVMKAAINWSNWVGGKLLPGCGKGVYDSDDEEFEEVRKDDSANLSSLAWEKETAK